MYADDLVIMSPSVAGLYKLIHICESFGLSHDVLFNNKNSTIMSMLIVHVNNTQFEFGSWQVADFEGQYFIG